MFIYYCFILFSSKFLICYVVLYFPVLHYVCGKWTQQYHQTSRFSCYHDE